jgi:hypothetical protein
MSTGAVKQLLIRNTMLVARKHLKEDQFQSMTIKFMFLGKTHVADVKGSGYWIQSYVHNDGTARTMILIGGTFHDYEGRVVSEDEEDQKDG